jgi:ribosomal protein S18 acetylase RimI-like enzyme
VEIREGTPTDLELLAHMRLEFLIERTGTPLDEVLATVAEPTRAYLQERAAAGDLWAWFAEDGGECVGAVAVVIDHTPPRPGDLRVRQGHVLSMYVRPERRREGIGRRLLSAAVDAARARDLRMLVLHATADGRPLYEALGFADPGDWMELRL